MILRNCQLPMQQMMSTRHRCNVFASPGTGKTLATLATLDALSLAEDVFPVLVVAPLRVANVVWDSETDRWFPGIRVNKMLGAMQARRDALKKPADLYTINPANLQWLEAELDGKWPFRTVVCDESTLIKNHRVHLRLDKEGRWRVRKDGKAKNARALVSKANKASRWINLTGTPTPIGAVDLWGQCWPIDYGRALGRTFSDFKHRWFRPAWGSSKEQERLEPLPGAEDEILDRIRHFSVSIDAYDYFDIKRPMVVDVKVALPAKARKLYDDMHEHSIVELQGGVAALGPNSGAKLMKCRQIASGHLRDEDGQWHSVHSAKLDALQELRDKLNGQPLLVAYYFKEDAKAILSRFKDAVLLPKDSRQREVSDAWNEGKVPMLLVHPQSAGHGLNLQWGGNNLCIYTVDWNAEFYEQVIERIGPTRQAQAGLNRLVYVHRLIAARTWDEVIVKNLANKMTVQQMVKEALAWK